MIPPRTQNGRPDTPQAGAWRGCRGTQAGRRCRGNALVEFALVLPPLLLVLLMLGEGAAMLSTYEVLVNAARAGVRLAVTPGELGRTSDIVNRVLAYAGANGVELSASEVSVQQGIVVHPGGAACSLSNPCLLASEVAVRHTYTAALVPPLPFGIPTTVPMDTAAVMRNFF